MHCFFFLSEFKNLKNHERGICLNAKVIFFKFSVHRILYYVAPLFVLKDTKNNEINENC